MWCTAGGVGAPTATSATTSATIPTPSRATAAAVAAAAGLRDPAGWVWMRQVHGADVHVATGADAGAEPPAADAAVTAVRGLPLAV